MKWIVALLLLFAAMTSSLACPVGETCIQYPGTVPYDVTGGSAARTPAARAVDNWIEANEASGIDCTGSADSTTAFQTLVNTAAWNKSLHIEVPLGCKIKLTNTITATDISGLTVESASFAGDGVGTPATFTWGGTNGGAGCTSSYASCVYMFDFEHSDHPVVRNLSFISPGGSNCPDGFLKFDGNPGTHEIGTNGRIIGNAFSNGSCSNANFIGVDISNTATNNHENYIVEDNYISCGQNGSSLRSRDGVTNGTTTITSATAAFVGGDVNARIRLSYALGYADTTIASVTNGTTAVIAAPSWSSGTTYQTGSVVTGSNSTIYISRSDVNTNHDPTSTSGFWVVMWTQSNVTIVTGTQTGIGYRNGASQNALQQQFLHLQYSGCATGIYLAGGNAELSHISGGDSDIGIFIGGFVAEQVSVEWYESESDFRGILTGGPLVSIKNSRMSNGNQLADGFFKFNGGLILLETTFVEFAAPTNGVLIGQGSQNPTVTSMSNHFGANAWAAVGYGNLTSPPVTSLNDAINGGAPASQMISCWNNTSAEPCLQVSNTVGHSGGAAVVIASSNLFSDNTTPVIGLQVTDSFGAIGSYSAISAAPSSGTVANANVPLNMVATTLAKLGACAAQGAVATVSNGSTATWGATDAGGGSNKVLDYCDGTNWTVAGK